MAECIATGCATIATGCAANLWSKGLIWLFKKVVAPVKVLICLRRAVTQMERDVENVVNDKNVIEAELREEQQRAKLRVNTWLETAETIRVRSGSIRAMYDAHQQHNSYLGCCPKCLCRCRISKDIRNLNRSLAQLHLQRAHPDFPGSGQYGNPTPRTQIPITQTGIVPNAMRSKQTDDIERWLTDENSNVQRIAIIGMGGVGKTSLLDAINNSQRVKSSFELIIKVIVSRNDISIVQKNVAERLKLSLPENSVERAYTLRNFFENKKYVILLDDMWLADSWTPDKLQELGVSFSGTSSKFVITTRDEQVCAMMHVQKTIKVEPLSEEQGWELFRSKAFVNQNGNVPDIIKPVAMSIAEECKGLPLAITVVGAAMAHHKELHEWQTALEQMQRDPHTFDGLYPAVDTLLFQHLKYCYDALSEDLQICFLSLAVFPEDAEIKCKELIDMWIAESVVKGSGDIYLHDTGHSYVEHLRNRCFIEVVYMDDVGRIKCVKIHDILRDLAVRIVEKKEPSYYLKAGQGMIDFPLEEAVSKGCVKLSLMYNNLQSLPTTFPCQSLSVLLLRENPSIYNVPQSFLTALRSLKVLDLSSTGITSLPESIGNLTHLAFLQLQSTHIYALPEAIGDLKELQFLNLRSCRRLSCLPKRISELTRLRALDISECIRLEHLPRGISNLVSLERLTMKGTNIKLEFEEEEEGDAERDHVCLKDLQTLTRLRVFSVHLKSPVREDVMGQWSKMRDLSLSVIGQRHLPQDMQEMRDLESLYLACRDLERLPSCVTQSGKLQSLFLWECDKLIEIPTDLPYLRKLKIFYCNNLKRLGAVGERASPFLPMLQSLQVGDCPELKTLSGRWDQLTHLEEISGERIWWDAIQWDRRIIKTSLQDKRVFHEMG